jgi:hypothetical protein
MGNTFGENMGHLARTMIKESWYADESDSFSLIVCYVYALLNILLTISYLKSYNNLGVEKDQFRWITPRFLDYCGRIGHIEWRFLSDEDPSTDLNLELLGRSALIRWSIYAKNNALFPNAVSVTHS